MATIRKRGPRQWEVRVRRKGYPTQSRTFEKKFDAEEWARAVESEMVRGVFVDRTEAEQTTLREALDRYKREKTAKKKGHQEAYVIEAWKKRPLALRSLASIRSSDLAAHRDVRLEEVGPKTVLHELNVISHLFNVARREWGMEGLANPVDGIDKPKASKPRDRRHEVGETERILEACATSRNPWLKPIVELAVETAMRRSELVSLEWKHVDLGRQVAHLPETKNGDPRDVPLSKRAVAILRDLPRDVRGRVFPVSADAVTRAFARACKRAGIEGMTFHDQRHEATSRLFEKDLNIMEASAVTGHKTLQMLKRYTKLRAEKVAKKLG